MLAEFVYYVASIAKRMNITYMFWDKLNDTACAGEVDVNDVSAWLSWLS